MERAALVALLRLGRGEPADWARQLEHEGGVLALLHRELSESEGQGTLLAEDPEPLLRQAQADIDGWSAEGLRLLTVLDADYPQNLREVHNRPPLLFTAGSLGPEDERSLAVIGSRQASTAGLAAAAQMAEALVAAGFVVVSGLARGIDTTAHKAALAAGGRTLAVVGAGLRRCYPPENEGLQRRIAVTGAVISQFWPEAPPSRHSFPSRNAVMSGIARGTVIIEASVRSGARVQARLALAQGRPVFLARALLTQDWAAELAQRTGVHIFDDPRRVIDIVRRLDATDALVE